ncbi:MAG TPA: gamma-glutamyltransferase [Acholeplasmataceae bacterium]|jgi:gamma-glutamyltranspeptidase/glutathione hydrolase|nr:gamma-glutamyltransferase [Acholeplasmataceae bacterium]
MIFSNNYSSYPFPSRRVTVFSKNGMVAAAQPLGAQAGLEILKKGGNAVDAAIATAACLTVVEATSNGIGGDAFAIVWMNGKIHGLNASGPAPKALTIDKLKSMGINEIPSYGFIPVTVPGVPSAWIALSKRFGKLPFKEVLAPAIKFAREGYPINPTLAYFWNNAYKVYQSKTSGEEFEEWFKTFAPNGRAPKVGEVWSSENHAKTLEMLADTECNSFYKGDIADKIDAFSRKYGGFIRKSDLENYEPEWVMPLKVNYRGYDVWELPPNGQGMIALEALNILKNFNFRETNSSSIHLQIEAMKLAFADGLKHITDPRFEDIPVNKLLSDDYGKVQSQKIKETAQDYSIKPQTGGTVYLATADKDGNMVSYIQSNYMGFGSGLVVPGTGIALQNRGHTFSLNPKDANALAPGKRTYHTIIPGFLSQGKNPIGPFGVMGGFMQPQGHLQVLMNTIDFKLNPQAAIDAPRWYWVKNKKIKVEQHMPNYIVHELEAMGHEIEIDHSLGLFGRGQIIWRNPETKVLCGGSEPRTDGMIALY